MTWLIDALKTILGLAKNVPISFIKERGNMPKEVRNETWRRMIIQASLLMIALWIYDIYTDSICDDDQ